MNRAVPAIITALLAAALAGCGNSGPEGGGSQAPAGGPTVSMKDITYIPETLEVQPGQTVTWTNDDAVAHTVTKTGGAGPQFDSGSVAGGATFSQKFDAPGRVDYVCTIHPSQKGAIVVKAP